MITENFLKEWAKKNSGEISIKTFLNIKSPDINISVEGVNFEDAVKKLEPLLNGYNDNTNNENKNNLVEAINSTLNTNTTPLNNDNINELLKGKQLIRMFDGKSMLNAGEQIIEINGLKYVVKESK